MKRKLKAELWDKMHYLFRDFNRDPVTADAGLVYTLSNLFHNITGIEIRSGKVNRMRRNKHSTGIIHFHHFQDLIDHIQIQFVDQTCIFKCRDEFSRRQKTFFRVDPSCQCLYIADLLIHGPDNRLQVYTDPFFRNSFIKIRPYIVPDLFPVTHAHRSLPQHHPTRFVLLSPR